MISQDTIDRVREATDIVELLSQYLRLKKRGRNYFAVCPFHVEKTPSFSVSADKQIYKCFGCDAGGNVFTFLMEHEKMTFIEAVRYLADKAGIRIEETRADTVKDDLDRLYYAHRVALEYYQTLLKSDQYRDRMMKYLVETRHLKPESIEFFGLGLAGESWDGFLKYALNKDLYPKDLELAGLIIRSEKRDSYFDRFRQRLMIPIFNQSGKPVAFGGRALKKGEDAKYVNSPETPLYHKSGILYGLNFSRQYIREKNEVIIVEGYFDLISLYQADIKNVVASSGTAFTLTQARLLSHFADTACLFFDSDSAGQMAALRSVDALYDAGLEVMVMSAPEGEDPDSLAVKGGRDAIEKVHDEAVSFIEYRIRRADLETTGIIAKEKLIKEFAALFKKVGDVTRRDVMILDAAERMKIPIRQFYNIMNESPADSGVVSTVRPPRKIEDNERDLLSLLICYPEEIARVMEKLTPDDFHIAAHRAIYESIIAIFRESGEFTEAALIGFIEDKAMLVDITALAAIDWTGYNISSTVRGLVKKIQDLKRERIIDTLKAQLKEAEDRGDSKTAERLQNEIMDLIKRREQ